MKETFYFSHDYASRSDEKIKKLIYKHGMEGYGIYWAIIEDLYLNGNKLETDYDILAYDLRCDSDTYKSIVENFDLFKIGENNFSSVSVKKRLQLRDAKSKKARESVNKRWNKGYERNTNVIRPVKRSQYDSNTIKESKVKDSKTDIDSSKLLDLFNSILGKKTKVVSDKAKKQLKARFKEGYTKEDIIQAIRNASDDSHHRETRYKYLTLEFITRADKLERFASMSDFKIQPKLI
jgi:uncharacterized phage protein (TIGR02220 family)